MKIITGAMLLFAFTNLIYSQTFPVQTIFENGPKENRINMVFVGDGYKITEMDKYHKDVQKAVSSIFLESPYKEYSSLFNVYAIEVPSNESGADHSGLASDCGAYKDSVFERDTYFNAAFDAGGIHRLVLAQDNQRVSEVLMNNFPEFDIPMMVVNHDWYGGSGGWISVFTTEHQSAEIAIHEAGHSFAGLDDEYDYGLSGPIAYEGVNVTYKTDREGITWNKWILPATPIPTPPDNEYASAVGLFEGAYYVSYGMYRPKLNCKMRILGVPFCEVCREQHVKSILSLINIIEDYTPVMDTVLVYANTAHSFGISTVQLPASNIVQWYLDGKFIAGDTKGIFLGSSELEIGIHTLSAKFTHATPYVLNDPQKILERSVEWTLNVLSTTDVQPDETVTREFYLEQNYPNPFNPSTNFKFQIPDPGFVSLKIFNSIGDEITTLVNEYKSAGVYEIKFDAGNLASGIYFYKLSAGGLTEVKKLMVLK